MGYQYILDHKYIPKVHNQKRFMLDLGEWQKDKFLVLYIWMQESPLTNKITQDLRPHITDTSTVSHFIDNNRIWNNKRLNSLLRK